MTPRPPTLFLPGAGASAAFWAPVAARLDVNPVFLAWPGLGREPPRADVNGVDDLLALVLARMAAPVNLVAQSLGGAIALRAALAAPGKVRRLVLTATSGGLPVADLGGRDWRAEYYAAHPTAARWIAAPMPDLSVRLGDVIAPTLLLWGDQDPISPVAVGERLLSLLPNARLRVVPGADHDLAQTHAAEAAALIGPHLA